LNNIHGRTRPHATGLVPPCSGKDGTSIDELTTVEIDADGSQELFKDRWRMSEDILSNGAAACIAKLADKDRVYARTVIEE